MNTGLVKLAFAVKAALRSRYAGYGRAGYAAPIAKGGLRPSTKRRKERYGISPGWVATAGLGGGAVGAAHGLYHGARQEAKMLSDSVLEGSQKRISSDLLSNVLKGSARGNGVGRKMLTHGAKGALLGLGSLGGLAFFNRLLRGDPHAYN